MLNKKSFSKTLKSSDEFSSKKFTFITSKLIFGMPFCAPREVLNALKRFENISFAASSSSLPRFSFFEISSSPIIHSLTALISTGVQAISAFALMSPLNVTLAITTGGFMPFCAGASNSFLSPISGALPVSPSMVAFNSFEKMLKNSFVIIFALFFVVVFVGLVVCH